MSVDRMQHIGYRIQFGGKKMSTKDLTFLSKSAAYTRPNLTVQGIYETLRSAILEGRLTEDDVLPTEDLAKQFGVSRTPIREALRELSVEGLVVLRPYRGAAIAGVSSEELRELTDVRILIEKYALSLAFPLKPEKIQQLEQLQARCEKVVINGEQSNILEITAEFHSALFSDIKNRYLLKIMDDIRSKMGRYFRLFYGYIASPEKIKIDHKMVLEAIKLNDFQKTAEALEAHLSIYKGELMDHLINNGL